MSAGLHVNAGHGQVNNFINMSSMCSSDDWPQLDIPNQNQKSSPPRMAGPSGRDLCHIIAPG